MMTSISSSHITHPHTPYSFIYPCSFYPCLHSFSLPYPLALPPSGNHLSICLILTFSLAQCPQHTMLAASVGPRTLSWPSFHHFPPHNSRILTDQHLQSKNTHSTKAQYKNQHCRRNTEESNTIKPCLLNPAFHRAVRHTCGLRSQSTDSTRGTSSQDSLNERSQRPQPHCQQKPTCRNIKIFTEYVTGNPNPMQEILQIYPQKAFYVENETNQHHIKATTKIKTKQVYKPQCTFEK